MYACKSKTICNSGHHSNLSMLDMGANSEILRNIRQARRDCVKANQAAIISCENFTLTVRS